MEGFVRACCWIFILSACGGISSLGASKSAKKDGRDAENSVQLEHNLGEGFEFIPKGHAIVKSTRAKLAVYAPASGSTPGQVTKGLEALEAADRSYVVRASVRLGWPVNVTSHIFSFARPCTLIHSRLSEKLHLHLTGEGEVISIAVAPQFNDCPAAAAVKVPSSFNTSCGLTQPSTGPAPDTASYIQKVQKEEEMRQRNPPDNRSFIQKYWMYIVPVLFFMMLSGGGQEQPRGGGGGGG